LRTNFLRLQYAQHRVYEILVEKADGEADYWGSLMQEKAKFKGKVTVDFDKWKDEVRTRSFQCVLLLSACSFYIIVHFLQDESDGETLAGMQRHITYSQNKNTQTYTHLHTQNIPL
jgi:hypothetical protein